MDKIKSFYIAIFGETEWIELLDISQFGTVMVLIEQMFQRSSSKFSLNVAKQGVDYPWEELVVFEGVGHCVQQKSVHCIVQACHIESHQKAVCVCMCVCVCVCRKSTIIIMITCDTHL